MRAEQSRLHTSVPGQEEEEEEEEDMLRMVGSGKSGCDADVSEAKPAQRMSGTPAVELSSVNQGPFCSDPRPLPALDGWDSHGRSPTHEPRLSPATAVQSSAKETFNSSFSFIQQSLNSCRTAETPVSQEPEPLNQLNTVPNSPQSKRPVQLLSSSEPADSEDLPPGRRFWQRCPWDGREVPSEPPEPYGDSVDIEITSSLSVDSDNASASSVTSGYDSGTPASEQGWDSLVKKYELVLQDCLQNNRTYTKVSTTGCLDSKDHPQI